MVTAKSTIPTLLVGVGGTGASVLAHVKRHLMNAYDNRVPETVAFAVVDTAKVVLASVGAEGVTREEGMGFGKVSLTAGDYIHVGGYVKQLVEEVANTNRRPHMKNWLMAEHYLKLLPDELFHLEEGAGMYRQLGRLAIYRDVLSPSNSALYTTIDNKLANLPRRTGDETRGAISVILVGSLVGGTGAGTFIDVAHLIKRIGDARGIPVGLRGIFFLPRAFAATLSPNDIQAAQGRTAAALRELRRFMLNEDYEFGYNMHYHGPNDNVNQEIWRSTIKGKLFGFIYLIDGEGQVRMNTHKLHEGIASVVADAVASFIDADYGATALQQAVNRTSKSAGHQTTTGKRAYVEAMGAYSIILPMQQIVEEWGYQLGREIIRTILPPDRIDDNQNILTLSSQKNPDVAGRNTYTEVKRLLESKSPIVDPDDAERKRMITPFSMWSVLSVIRVAAQENEVKSINEWSQFDVTRWLGMFVPPETEADEQTRRARTQTATVLSQKLRDYILPSDERKPKGNPAEDWREIKSKGDTFTATQLGKRDQVGGREGGAFRDALDRFRQLHVNRFKIYMVAYCESTLNGTLTEQANPIIAKTGRLGWLLGVFTELDQSLTEVGGILQKISVGTGELYNRQRQAMENTLTNSEESMKRNAGEKGGLFKENPAITTQHAYFAAVDSYVNFFRTEASRDAVWRTVMEMRDFVRTMLTELREWLQVLVTDDNGLDRLFSSGLRRVQGERVNAATAPNHNVIRDREWEDKHYEEYILKTDARDKLFTDWKWGVGFVEDVKGDRTVFRVKINVSGTPLTRERTGRWSEKNSRAFLNACRDVFTTALTNESIVKYLMENEHQYGESHPDVLARELASKSAYQLNIPEVSLTTVQFTDVLLARISGSGDENTYLREVLRQLDERRGRGGGVGGGAGSSRHTCDDPFRLTILTLAENVPLDGITAYTDAMSVYLALPYTKRQENHILPAEVNVAYYEEMLLSKLQQNKRQVEDRVALLLEDIFAFKEFLVMVAHGMIQRVEYQAANRGGGSIEYLWVLKAADRKVVHNNDFNQWLNSNPQEEEWWLTLPRSYNQVGASVAGSALQDGSLLDAMMTYIFRKADIRGVQRDAQANVKEIPRDYLNLFLDFKIRFDTLQALQQDTAGSSDRFLRQWVEAYLPPVGESPTAEQSAKLFDVANRATRHDRLSALGGGLMNEAQQHFAKKQQIDQRGLSSEQSFNEKQHNQELYDLYSISAVLLMDECEQLRRAVQNRFEADSGSHQGPRLS